MIVNMRARVLRLTNVKQMHKLTRRQQRWACKTRGTVFCEEL